MSEAPASDAAPTRAGPGRGAETGSWTRAAVLRALSVPVGLGLSWWWVASAPALIESVTYGSGKQAVVVFYCALFGPLVLLAAALGIACRARPFRIGARPLPWFAAGLAAGAGGIGFAVLAAWLHGGTEAPSSTTVAPGLFALGIALTLLQTSAEEFLIRGWLQPVLIGFAGPVAGILAASALFAGLHLASGPVAPHSLVNMVLAGALFGVLAWRSGGMAAPVAAHFAWNLVEDLGFGLVPNPGVGPFGALADIDIAGPALWGGGAEGLNASAATTVVLLAMLVPIIAWPRRTVEPRAS